MLDNIQVLFLEKDMEYIRCMSAFLGRFLESNKYSERIYIDTLIYMTRNCDFNPEVVVRYRTIMELVSSDVMRDNVERILEASREKEKMRIYIKKELEIWAKQAYSGDTALIALINKR